MQLYNILIAIHETLIVYGLFPQVKNGRQQQKITGKSTIQLKRLISPRYLMSQMAALKASINGNYL